MKRRKQLDSGIFPDLDSLFEIFIILFIFFDIPYLIGFYANKWFFSGSLEENRMWGSCLMFAIPVISKIADFIKKYF